MFGGGKMAGIANQLRRAFLSKSESTLVFTFIQNGAIFTTFRTKIDSVSTENREWNKNAVKDEASLQYVSGRPQLTLPLPSRREKCVFALMPVSESVGDLLQHVAKEDRGVDRVVFRTVGGNRIASSNKLEVLLSEDFEIVINDDVYRVKVPDKLGLAKEEEDTLCHVRALVSQLYTTMNLSEHQSKKERELLVRLERLRDQLEPLEKKRESLTLLCEKRTNTLSWLGLGMMAVQFGVLARLTWWEYSWDIMEPVTYFVTYGTGILVYAYYVLTKQEYLLPDVRDREFLKAFHKRAKKLGLEVDKYNKLKDEEMEVCADLRRLRDPIANPLLVAKSEVPLTILEQFKKVLKPKH